MTRAPTGSAAASTRITLEQLKDLVQERGLADEVVEALALCVQKRDAVGLHDRPDDAGEDGERAEELDSDDPAVPA